MLRRPLPDNRLGTPFVTTVDVLDAGATCSLAFTCIDHDLEGSALTLGHREASSMSDLDIALLRKFAAKALKPLGRATSTEHVGPANTVREYIR
jgi:hypothetical protein